MARTLNIADHSFLAHDDLTDCAANMAAYIGAVANTFTASAVTVTPVTIDGFSTAQTGDLLDVFQNAGGKKIFSVATVASAVNGVTVTASSTGNAAAIAAMGNDATVGLKLDAKGAAAVSIGTVSTGGITLGDTITIADAKNIVLNATTGTKIGTATTQKLGFFNSTPITQPALTGSLSTVADAPAKAVLTSIIAALKATGLGLVNDTTT